MTFQSKRGERDGNATESGDDQAGSPLHVLSDVAQKECQWGASPEAAAVDGAQNRAFSRTQTRHIGSTASAAPSGLGELVAAKGFSAASHLTDRHGLTSASQLADLRDNCDQT